MDRSSEVSFSVEVDKYLASWLAKGDMVPFKTGLYTTMMMAFVALSLFIIYAIYCLLEAFIQPIMWAVLVGTVLFPVKLSIAKSMESWVDNVQKSGTPFCFAVFATPWRLADVCFTALVSRVATKSNLILLVVYFFIWCFSRTGPLVFLLSRLQVVWSPLDTMIRFGASSRLYLFIIPYFLCICISVRVLKDNVDKVTIRLFSVPVWFLVICKLAGLFGPYRTLVALILSSLLICINLELFPAGKPTTDGQRQKSKVNYTHLAFGAAACVFLFKCNYAFFLVTLLCVCAVLSKTGAYFVESGWWSGLCDRIGRTLEGGTVNKLYRVWFPHQMRHFLRDCFCGTPQFFQKLKQGSSLFASLTVMALMVFGLCILSIFLLVQVTDEMTSLTMLTSDLVQRTWTNSSTMPDFFEKAFPSADHGNILETVYANARVWLSAKLRDVVAKDNPQRAEVVEAQLLHLIDELYRVLKEGESKLTTVGDQSVYNLWHRLGSLEFRELVESVTLIVQTNLALVSTVLETLWTLVTANLSAIFSLTTPLLWEVFTFGYGIVNLCLQMVMFATTLNFLLISSTDTWLPADLIASMLPFSNQSNGGADCNVFYTAFQRSVRSVFVISLNISLFYGFYTWLVCALFGLSMTVVPSISAAILATVPIMPQWCVCFPGVIELWLVNGDTLLAVLLFICFIVPQLFVQESFYAELNDSHPYLTGLAVCGGVYWLGLQGAIIGPILLCCFLFIVTLYRSFGKSISAGDHR